MQITAICKRLGLGCITVATTRKLLAMRLVTLVLLFICLNASAQQTPETVTLSFTDVPLETVFKEIRKQTGYKFLYTSEQAQSAGKVSLSVTGVTVEVALHRCLERKPLTFTIENKVVVIRSKEVTTVTHQPSTLPNLDLSGLVTNEKDEPVPAANVLVKGTLKMVATNETGSFSLPNVRPDAVLKVTCIGYVPQEIVVQGNARIHVRLQMAINNLDETVVIAYGSTTKKLNTGSVSKVSAEVISHQPVSNPLAALQGRVTGLQITQGNGLPGSGFSVLIRGRNSIQNGVSPLFIIDGVPFLTTEDNLTQRGGLNANNPFNTINPEEIASIEVLKDADATAIYGSRGANGVILITTKKAKPGESLIEASLYHAWSKATRSMEFMDTKQYLNMRREAFANDGVQPNASNAPDLFLWDTTRNYNWRKQLTGETAKAFNANLRYSGGNEITYFTLGAGYRSESTLFPNNDFGNRQTNFNLVVTHRPRNNKLSGEFSASYSTQRSYLPKENVNQFLRLPPHAMKLYTETGGLNWTEGAEFFGNPAALFQQTLTGNTQRFSGNGVFKYRIIPNLTLNVTSGYNGIWFEETAVTPVASQNPSTNPLGSANFGNNNIHNWAVEPQLHFSQKLGTKGKLMILAGASWQESKASKMMVSGSGYTSDALIGSLSGAATTIATSSKSQYRYRAIFSRINYNWDNRYLINITARRDGSSRFGPDRRHANFAAVGAGWIFSNTKWLNSGYWLSYGKLRGSYGITGNDQINNYQYLDSWVGTRYPYMGLPGYRPSKLFNPNYSWEQIRKTEAALELGFYKNRVLLNVNWFNSKSDNQIINYNLPSQTGFDQILRNFPGVVQNKGVEIQVDGSIIKRKHFEWSAGFNITVAKNKLVEFPGLEFSTYSSRYMIGRSLNSYIGYRSLGVDPQTGLYRFEDINKNGIIDYDGSDNQYLGTNDPVFYGGFQNTIRFKGIELDFLFEFKKQRGIDNIKNSGRLIGGIGNIPVQVLNRWTKPGEVAEYQRFSQDFTSPAYETAYQYSMSDAILTGASYIRLKNLSLSYDLDQQLIQRAGLSKCRLFVEAQNLFTMTNYPGADPENQSLVALSPLRTIAVGLKLTIK